MWSTAATGLFAVVGGLAAWGAGPIWSQDPQSATWLQWTDLLVTGPLCLLTAATLRRRHRFAPILAAATGGVLVFGSVAVYVQVLSDGPPYPMTWVLLPLAGLALAAALLWWAAEPPAVS